MDGLPDPRRLAPAERLLLAVRILADSLEVWHAVGREPLPDLVARLGHHPTRPGARIEPRRLGRIVHRVMNVGPFRPRCLTMALVLFRGLRRQGTEAELVVGLPRGAADRRAHAWVEVGGAVVGPPPGRLGHAELARFGGPVARPGADPPSRGA